MIILCKEVENNQKTLIDVENLLRKGGVAIVPTDTVYGLICDGMNDSSKKKIFKIKGRSQDKPLIGFVDNIKKLEKFAELSPQKKDFLKEQWPGSVTFILQSRFSLPYLVSKTGKIAFRIPCHGFLLKLLKRFEILASTSANISGEKAPSRIEEIPDILKGSVDILIDGGLLPGSPSRIIDITGKDIVRLR